MNVTLIGMGSGQPENLTLQGLAALRQADLILGARRLLAVLPAGCTENRAAAYRPDEVAELLQTSGAENAVLVYSGDTGFYSGASSMMESWRPSRPRRVLPAFPASSCWRRRWAVRGRGGTLFRPMAAPVTRWPSVCRADPPSSSPAAAKTPPPSAPSWRQRASGTCRPSWASARHAGRKALPRQRQRAGRRPLQQPERPSRGGGGGTAPAAPPGLPDEAFERGDVPMTKQEVRAAVAGEAGVRPEDILWDVGAGTGSVSVELALARPGAGCTRWSAGRRAVRSSKPTAKNSGPGISSSWRGLPPPPFRTCPRRTLSSSAAARAALPPSWTPRWIRTPTPASVCRPSPLRAFRRRWPR